MRALPVRVVLNSTNKESRKIMTKYYAYSMNIGNEITGDMITVYGTQAVIRVVAALNTIEAAELELGRTIDIVR